MIADRCCSLVAKNTMRPGLSCLHVGNSDVPIGGSVDALRKLEDKLGIDLLGPGPDTANNDSDGAVSGAVGIDGGGGVVSRPRLPPAGVAEEEASKHKHKL